MLSAERTLSPAWPLGLPPPRLIRPDAKQAFGSAGPVPARDRHICPAGRRHPRTRRSRRGITPEVEGRQQAVVDAVIEAIDHLDESPRQWLDGFAASDSEARRPTRSEIADEVLAVAEATAADGAQTGRLSSGALTRSPKTGVCVCLTLGRRCGCRKPSRGCSRAFRASPPSARHPQAYTRDRFQSSISSRSHRRIFPSLLSTTGRGKSAYR